MKQLNAIFVSDWFGNPYKNLLINNLNSKGVEVKECLPKVENVFGRIFFLPLVLRQGKFDILHFHTLHPFILGKNSFSRLIKLLIFTSQIFILNLLGVKVVWTVHEWHDKMDDGQKNISSTQSAVIGKFLDAIITHCETTKNEITRAFKLENKNKVFVIPHGNYIGTYENKISQIEARKILGISLESLNFLIFGSIYRYKGVLEAIEAFKKLQQPETYLLIAGKSYETQLEETILEKIQGHENILFFHQVIPNDEIQVYINACDCFVVPYKVFTTSGVAILGMSYGRACIAPNMGFFNDVLDEYGSFLYDSNHEDGLLQAMKSTIDNKCRLAEMGRHNLTIAEKWNWNYVSEQTLNVYQQCLGIKY
ncbi:glycosyltransferase [Nostoc sp. B(2019)]|nr:glycosyltransferase [Nostoc sp. B(2019)]